jgi:hypothetical protein
MTRVCSPAVPERAVPMDPKVYPPDGPLDMSKERARENMSSKLYDKYTLPIRNRLKITKLDLSMIEMEGVENRWPRPPSK